MKHRRDHVASDFFELIGRGLAGAAVLLDLVAHLLALLQIAQAGALDGASFLAYVEQILAPTLSVGETVVMDNVRTHKVAGVRKAIEARGANVLYLPPYSPDFNPIEKPFSKIKSILERIAARTVDALEVAVGEALQSFTPQECMNYFASSGYDAA